jgi:hypothetical protein
MQAKAEDANVQMRARRIVDNALMQFDPSQFPENSTARTEAASKMVQHMVAERVKKEQALLSAVASNLPQEQRKAALRDVDSYDKALRVIKGDLHGILSGLERSEEILAELPVTVRAGAIHSMMMQNLATLGDQKGATANANMLKALIDGGLITDAVRDRLLLLYDVQGRTPQ